MNYSFQVKLSKRVSSSGGENNLEMQPEAEDTVPIAGFLTPLSQAPTKYICSFFFFPPKHMIILKSKMIVSHPIFTQCMAQSEIELWPLLHWHFH